MKNQASIDNLSYRVDQNANTLTIQDTILKYLTDAHDLASKTGQLSNDELREIRLVRVTLQSRRNALNVKYLEQKGELAYELGQLNLFEI